MQGIKRKAEEMKMKIYSLRTQKTELNGRIQEMQSTISSLRDEQRAIELSFQEKQNEAKLVREKYMEMKDQNPQVKALTEALQQKEAEIEVLKHRLHANSDEHLNLSENTTAKANVSSNETMIHKNKYRDMHNEEHREGGKSINGRSETSGNEEVDRVENFPENGRTGADGRSSETVREKEDETEKMVNLGNEEVKNTRDEDDEANATDSRGFATMGDNYLRRISMQENIHSGHYRFRGKRGYLKRVNGKRWRSVAEQTKGKRSSLNNGASTMGDKGIVIREEGKPRYQDELQNPIKRLRLQNESVSKDGAQGEEVSNVKAYNEENDGEHSEETKVKPEENTEETSHKEQLGKSRVSQNEQTKEQEIVITEHAETDDNGQHDNSLGQNEVAERKDADGLQTGRFEESVMGEDSEDKELTDETEF